MLSPGTVLFDDTFRFSDGTIGRKLLILVSEPTQEYTLLLKTTSKNRYKTPNYGCHLHDHHPNFSIPLGKSCLNEPTWVDLSECFEWRTQTLQAKCNTGIIKRIGCLPDEVIYSVLGCAVESRQISKAHKRILQACLSHLSPSDFSF